MKKICLLTMLLSFSLYMMAQVNYPIAAAKVQRYYNQQQADSFYAMFGPAMKAALPPDQTRAMLSQLHSQLGELLQLTPSGGDATYQSWKAAFTKGALTMILALNKDNQLEGFRFIPYQEKAIVEKDPDNFVLHAVGADIVGTLTMPVSNAKVPVVLLIAGSGPTDRNCNSKLGINTNAFKMLAEALQADGIACLRYDKRGVGASVTSQQQSEVTFDIMVDDASGMLKMLKEDQRFSTVVVAGHSEGSLIGMLAAQREKADRYISIAGSGERIDLIIERQLNAQSPPLAQKAKLLFDSLRQGQTIHNTEPTLQTMFYPGIQPYIASWMKYTPSEEIKKLKIPKLIIQGTEDIQVSINDAHMLQQAGAPALLKEINGMNHVLKNPAGGKSLNDPTYRDPTQPLNLELVKDIEEFVKGVIVYRQQ
ncbi:serine aminopeptidase domain-containing protein [Chitinophaga sp. HK235]|uniref:serine aminopeptidase domain-containing protein n=1 Tax=Chitinophaga sp. HK235 TaxID=2952571 RepID=UPI001BA7D497|nr:alpha/beta hydrolase [Chitinophaga sp. HK235]